MNSYEPARCQRCGILIYSSRDEAVAANDIWLRTHGRVSVANEGSHVNGVRFVPHLNGNLDGMCVACTAERDNKSLEPLEVEQYYNQLFGGAFPGPADPELELETPNEDNMKQRLSNDDVMAAHRRYVVDGATLSELSKHLAITDTALRMRFKGLQLPLRGRGGAWSAPDLARAIDAHGLNASDVPLSTHEKQKSPKTQRSDDDAADVCAPTSAQTTALSTPSIDPAVAAVALVNQADAGDQLAALQQLMDTITHVQNVRITGAIRIHLHAEIVF